MYSIVVNTGIATYNVQNLGPEGSEGCVVINGEGTIHFNDVNDKSLGPSNPNLPMGVCITFRSQVWAFRYNGMGQLTITFNPSTRTLTLVPQNGGTVTELTGS